MKNQFLKLKYVIHTFNLALYYCSYLYVSNILQLPFLFLLKPLFIFFLSAGFIIFIINLFVKNTRFAAILVSLFLIFTFSFPQLLRIIPSSVAFDPANPTQFNNSLIVEGLISLFLFIIIILFVLILRKRFPFFPQFMNSFLNIISTGLLVMLVIQAASSFISTPVARNFNTYWHTYIDQNTRAITDNSTSYPDIYLIVLDGYGSREVLQEIYEYDDTGFENELKDMGFTVIPQAKSNYSQTRLVFSSILNMSYINDLEDSVDQNTTDAQPLIEIINDNLVLKNLKSIGYETIAFPTGYPFTETMLVDKRIFDGFEMTELDNQILVNSIFYPLFHNFIYSHYQNRVLYTLDTLPDLGSYSSPKFVFAHILSPHPPFVFDKSGNPITPPIIYNNYDVDNLINLTSPEYYQSSYVEQLEFISQKTLTTIRGILANSDTPPIIILCGDHGPGLNVSHEQLASSNHYERFHILYSLYLPGVDPETIPDDLSPVNTFRFIFNEYFGTDYAMLENRSYASQYSHPFNFVDVTDLVDINQSR